MTLEQRIKELERQLALKKAYKSVKVSFGRGNNIPEEIRKEVTEHIQTFCDTMADRIDKSAEQEQQKVDNHKQETNPQPQQEQPQRNVKQVDKPLTAVLMTTDHLSKEMKQLVSSNTEVQVVGLTDEEASVQAKTRQGLRRFTVPKADLELQEQE